MYLNPDQLLNRSLLYFHLCIYQYTIGQEGSGEGLVHDRIGLPVKALVSSSLVGESKHGVSLA